MENKDEIIADAEDYIEVCVGISQYTDHTGLYILEEDFSGGGEIWRVHLNDPDPFPSKPHAHCMSGRFVGCKLHLGTAQLYKRKKALNKFLDNKQFLRLIKHFQAKFPDVVLPLPV